MIRHITYTDENMTISAAKCSESALTHGCDTSFVYKCEHLSEYFKWRNSETLNKPRGAGYWIWKPEIIRMELEKAQENDIVLYTDAGVEIIGDVRHLANAMDEIALLFHNQWWHHEWCKGDVMATMQGYKPTHQLQATAMLWLKCVPTMRFIKEWLMLCETPGFIDDSPSRTPNHEHFQEHRHDQAILTSLQIGRINSHWWPASYVDGKFTYPKNGERDGYPVIFNHHRKRNNEWQA
jgi:hypothetical protein